LQYDSFDHVYDHIFDLFDQNKKLLFIVSFAASLNQTTPYYDELISMINVANARPSISEYPQVAEHIHQALNEVFYGIKEPNQASADAAAKSAKALGW
jgi:multiple sugar transport system substrate-binding protein